MRTALGFLAVFALTASALAQPNFSPRIRVAATCFFQYEQSAGMNKICYYDCLGSPAAITISSVALCPLSISR